MIELEVIDQQIAFLANQSHGRELTLEEVKKLESLVRSKVLLTTKAVPATADENPFEDMSGEDLRSILEQSRQRTNAG